MSRMATNEYIGAKRRVYALADCAKRTLILDEVCETTGYERKYANRLLTGSRKFRKQKVDDRILELVSANPKIKTIEMARVLDLMRNGVNYHLRSMKTKGFLRREGSTKNGSWISNI